MPNHTKVSDQLIPLLINPSWSTDLKNVINKDLVLCVNILLYYNFNLLQVVDGGCGGYTIKLYSLYLGTIQS